MPLKKELQDQLTAKDKEIEDLRNELSGHALRAGDLEDEINELYGKCGVLLDQPDEEKVDLVVADLAMTIDGLARMLVYANSVALTILAYNGPDPQRVKGFANTLLEDLAPFMAESADDQFNFEAILQDVENELYPNVDPPEDYVKSMDVGMQEIEEMAAKMYVSQVTDVPSFD
jgi:hypothetical protein